MTSPRLVSMVVIWKSAPMRVTASEESYDRPSTAAVADVSCPPMNEAEWQTRKERIDKRLRATQPPWKIIRYRDGLDLSTLTCHAVEEFPTANGPADYGLFVHGHHLGVIEAKNVTLDPQNARKRAIRSSRLADSEPVAIKSLVRMNGVFLKKGETAERTDTKTGQKALDQLEDERAFEAADIERSITELEAMVDDLRDIVELLEKEEGVEK